MQEQIMRRAFTLIELLIVVAIIAILAAIAVPNFLEAQVRAKVSRAKSDMRSIVTALETYRVDNTGYPSFEGLTNLEDNARYLNSPLWILTTPIAYMTTLPAEAPFGHVKAPNYPNQYFRGYYYIGGDYWTFWAPSLISTYHQYPEPYINASYVLSAIGPTQQLTIPGIRWPYDPTNGTVSRGDILYVGGSGAGAGFHSFN